MELSPTIDLNFLTRYLQEKAWVKPSSSVLSVEKPGEGNMNRVLRLKTQNGSIILKQATDHVVKYPDIPAPISRIAVENQFYQLAGEIEGTRHYFPEILGYDPAHHLLAMEDLGESSDYTYLYQKGQAISVEAAEEIGKTLGLLHAFRFPEKQRSAFPSNLELKQLNHQHIFVLPLMAENGFDLNAITPGLQALSTQYKTDPLLKSRAAALGELYLGSGETLLHGDYYPGSWLRTSQGFKIIDPEFCFFGPPEFDLGVLLAHLKLAQQPEDIQSAIVAGYGHQIDPSLLGQFQGIEIIRRLIGLAQLPLDIDLMEKETLLAFAYQQLMTS